MKLKLLAIWTVIAFSLGACGGGSDSGTGGSGGGVSGIEMPERVEIIQE